MKSLEGLFVAKGTEKHWKDAAALKGTIKLLRAAAKDLENGEPINLVALLRAHREFSIILSGRITDDAQRKELNAVAKMLPLKDGATGNNGFRQGSRVAQLSPREYRLVSFFLARSRDGNADGIPEREVSLHLFGLADAREAVRSAVKALKRKLEAAQIEVGLHSRKRRWFFWIPP
jgi:hypothetical protein